MYIITNLCYNIFVNEREMKFMYIIYETYTDETRNMKDLRFNTRIVGLYNDKKIAKEKLEEHLEQIQLDLTDDNNWFVRKYDKKLMKEQVENAVEIYEIFNEFIDNCEEVFYVVLEKVECDLNDNNN